MEALALDVADMAPEEFDEELREEGLDPERLGAEGRRIRLEALKSHRLKPLRAARARYERHVAEYEQARVSTLPGTPDTRRAALDAILSGHMAASLGQLTAQFRDLKGMSGEDVDSLYRQMILLGVIDPEAAEPEPAGGDES